MAGSRRDEVEGGDPYRAPGNRAAGVHVATVLRVLVGTSATYAIDGTGRTHVLDASGALKSSIETGPFADAALFDDGAAIAVASYGRGVTTIHAGALAHAGSAREPSSRARTEADRAHEPTIARRFVSHTAPVLACASVHDALVVGDQAGEITRLLPERSAVPPFQLRSQILSIACSGSELAVLTAEGEVRTGTTTLEPVRGLRPKRPFAVIARPGGAGALLLDRERVHAFRGTVAGEASRDFTEGLATVAAGRESAWALTELGHVHHLDAKLRASPALSLGVSGRVRGMATIGGQTDLCALWTTRGELALLSPDGRARTMAREGVLAAALDPRTGDVVAVQSDRGLAVRRYAPNSYAS